MYLERIEMPMFEISDKVWCRAQDLEINTSLYRHTFEFFELNSYYQCSPRQADVAELVDAQVSEACDGDIVGVRFSPSAPQISRE